MAELRGHIDAYFKDHPSDDTPEGRRLVEEINRLIDQFARWPNPETLALHRQFLHQQAFVEWCRAAYGERGELAARIASHHIRVDTSSTGVAANGWVPTQEDWLASGRVVQRLEEAARDATSMPLLDAFVAFLTDDALAHPERLGDVGDLVAGDAELLEGVEIEERTVRTPQEEPRPGVPMTSAGRGGGPGGDAMSKELLDLVRALLEHHDEAMVSPAWLCRCYRATERAPHDLVEPDEIVRARALTGVASPMRRVPPEGAP